jgi:2,3-bisphosphoglycerate-dependent phosphoglycerate mutase
VHTIAPLSGHLGVKLEHVADLRERVFTNARVADWATTWKTAWKDPSFAFPDGESGRDAQIRIYAAMIRIATTSRARTLAVSSHGNVIALLLHRIHSSFTLEQASAIRNPDVFRLTYDGTALCWDDRFTVTELETFATTFG